MRSCEVDKIVGFEEGRGVLGILGRRLGFRGRRLNKSLRGGR